MRLKKFDQQNKDGFTLIEIIIYLFITAMLLTTISGLVMSNFNARKQLRSANLVNHDARFIINYLTNRIHNVEMIDDVRPDTYQILFYSSDTIRFSLSIESGNLVYRETEDAGSGFPEQSTVNPVILNSSNLIVSDLILTPIADNQGNTNQGVILNFTITTNNTEGSHGYVQQNFNTFITIR